jgi:hypothetical protein
MSTEAYTDKIREGAFSAMQATKTHFSMKEVMQDISKLSAGTLIKFQGNPKALAATVVEAKKLGLTLEQVNKTGDTLLNFESSIESELKAELMTGKQLNMERARAAALAGDQATLTKEIGEQVGTLNDYQNMNVLAQQSLAEAFGMSRDEMSEMSHVYESRPIPNMNGSKYGSWALSKPDMTFNPCKIPSSSDFGDMEDYIDDYSDTHLQAEVELLESILYQEQQY